MQRIRPLDVILDEVVVPLRNGDIESLVGHDAAFVERILERMAHRDELEILLDVRESEPGHQLDRFDASVAGPLQLGNQGL